MPPSSEVPVRERIVETADRLIARFGYKKMTMDDLARDVGVGKGTLYLHFDSKEAIALATVDRVVGAAFAEMERLAGTPDPAAARIRAMLRARVLVRLEGVRSQTESLDGLLAAIRPRLLERRVVHFRREAELLARVVREGITAGELAADDPDRAARALVTATNSLLPYDLSREQLGQTAAIEDRVLAVADLVLDGLRAR